MKKIVLANRKGGVGKTTLAYNLGASYIAAGYSVLFVDLDSQGNLTTLCGLQPITLDEWKATKVQRINSRLSVLPATKAFSQLTDEVNKEFDRNSYLKNTILPELEGLADVLIIDTPPALDVLNINAFCIADTILVPVNPDSFSLQGLKEMEQIINKVKTINPTLEYKTVLNAYFNRQTFTAASRETLQKYPAYSGVEIPHRAIFAKANATRKPAITEPEIHEAFNSLQGAIA